MMARSQISLDPVLHRRARQRAGEQGISLAEYVRRLVAADLEGQARGRPVDAVFDLGTSSGSDVAREKDRYLGEAVEGLRSDSERSAPD
jgi:hypothetical protein